MGEQELIGRKGKLTQIIPCMQALLREIPLWGSFLLLCKFLTSSQVPNLPFTSHIVTPGGGGGVLPYKGLMGTCGQPGYVLRDFCLEQGTDFITFCLNQGIAFLKIFVLNRVSFLGQ